MNIRRILLGLAIAAIAVSAVQAQTFKVSGAGVESVSIGDTLSVPDGGDAVIRLEPNTRLLVKGGSSVILAGQAGAVDAVLEDGQIFLDRGLPHELASVRMVTRGFTFTPAGTAAAVKVSPHGAPTVAVLRGTVRMQSDRGQAVTVGAGQFGTVDNGKLVSGELNEKGIAQLEAWTGVKADVHGDGGGVSSASEQAKPAAAPAAPAPVAAASPAQAPAAPVAAAADAGGADPSAHASPEVPGADDRKADGKKSAPAGPTPIFSKPDFELSAGIYTVNGEPWTRLALGVDVPIWRFGVFLDVEFFIDSDGKLSNKGWNFKDEPAEAIYRKIRYIRYGRENDPLFIKFGGLSNVTLGYGIIMDRFTNMLNYPDEKLLGLQFYLSDISSIGLTVQTLVSDFAELGDEGGIVALRAGFKPLKPSGIFLLDGLTVGGTYALDRNTWAPARKWKVSPEEEMLDSIRGMPWFDDYRNIYNHYNPGKDLDEIIDRLDDEKKIRKGTKSFAVFGFDAAQPIISTSLLGVTLYGQTAFRADSVSGWGMGAPGVAFNLWRLNGNVEYRKVEGFFTPGFFDAYYLDERFSRGLLKDKSEYLDSVSLNGVYGRLGMDMYGLLYLDGSYQYMVGADDAKDRRFELTAGIGQTVMERIPKINKAEVYVRHTNVGRWSKFDKDGSETDKKGGHFDPSPSMFWGYRAGFEITGGASLIWDYRYGWTLKNGRLTPNNHILLETALRF